MAHNSLPSSTLCLRRSQPAFIDAAPKFLQDAGNSVGNTVQSWVPKDAKDFLSEKASAVKQFASNTASGVSKHWKENTEKVSQQWGKKKEEPTAAAKTEMKAESSATADSADSSKEKGEVPKGERFGAMWGNEDGKVMEGALTAEQREHIYHYRRHHNHESLHSHKGGLTGNLH
eukprot:CAMPEP_0177707328 /NCGR_PEP_ID=MMETSP0484_2-20121128/9692_1 /TAXON_ID=354590 /ORGANISM="Rhodomonas lens, Strain RHODO" /LENGTH=173 /DNA_ID=CAMNT_0019218833 /DNA_START=147 /DNA_END=668 /DNA_ORIENTATION=+